MPDIQPGTDDDCGAHQGHGVRQFVKKHEAKESKAFEAGEKEEKKELLGKGQGIDNSRMLVGNGGNMLGMSVQELYDMADGKR